MTVALPILSQKYRLQWPLTGEQVEGLDEMIEDLYTQIRVRFTTTGLTLPTITFPASGVVGDVLYFDTTTSMARLAIGALGTMLIGGTLPSWSPAGYLSTSLQTPLVFGGTAVGSTLTLKSTNAVGTTDAIIFQVGSNGATEGLRINHAGLVSFGGTSASFPALKRSSATLQVRLADDSDYADLYALSMLLPSAAGFLAVGPTVATAGKIRLEANSTGIQARNNANTGNVGVFTTDGADNIVLGFFNVADIIFKPSNVESARVNTSGIQIVATSAFYWNGRSVLLSPADSQITLTNNANTAFDRLNFGGTTSSYPAVKRSSAELHARLADDSDFATLVGNNIGAGRSPVSIEFGAVRILDLYTAGALSTLSIHAGGTSFEGNFATDGAGVYIDSVGHATAANNAIHFRTTNTNSNYGALDRLIVSSTGLLQFGGTSASFPALKQASTILEHRLADDSAYAGVKALEFYTTAAAFMMRSVTAWTAGSTANVPTLLSGPVTGDPTKWIAVDDNGTTRYIPAW